MRSGFAVGWAMLWVGAPMGAQISITAGGAAAENFNSIGPTASATLPPNWKMSAAGTTNPTWSDATNVTAVSAAASGGAPTSGGRYNWGSSITTSDRAIGFLTSSGYASPNSIMAFFRNNSAVTLNSIAVSFAIERYRNNTAAASVAFFYSTDGSTWTAVVAGDVSTTAIPVGSTSAYDFALSGGSFVSVVNRSFSIGSIPLPPAADLYLRWTFITTGGNSQGLGLDNVTVSPPPPVITAQPSPQTITVEGSASFSVSATGNGTLSYQWRKGGTAITGTPSATTPTLNVLNVTSASAGNYDVIVTDSMASATSAAAALTVNKAAGSVTLDSLTQTYNGTPRNADATTVPAGRTVTFTYNGSPTPPTNAGLYALVATINDPDYQGSASGTFTITKANANVTLGALFQAYNGTPRAATATTLPAGLNIDLTYDGASTPPTDTGAYVLVGTINHPNYQGSASAGFVITHAPQSIAFPAPADHFPGDTPFTVSATSSSGLPVTLAIISGSPGVATLSGNTITLTGATGTVTLRATQDGGGNFAPAPPVDRTFHVLDVLTAPALTRQPVAVTLLLGETVRLSGAASGSPAPTYQWMKDGVPLPPATGTTLTIPHATPADNGLYVLTATNSLGTVSSVPVAVLVNKRAQSISFGPSATSFPAGPSVTLNPVSTAGLPLTLSFVSGSGSLAGNLLTGTGDVIIRASQAGNATYAAVTVDRTFSFVAGAFAPFLLLSPMDQVADAGGTATFQVSALGVPAPSYQWQKDGGPIAGAASPTLVLTGLTLVDAARYTIVATNSGGVATASAQLVVRAAPVIVGSPGDQAVLAGEPVQLAVAVTGVPAPGFQWRKNGVNIPGATSALLAIPGARSSDAGRYDVVVTNPLGSATSAIATLAVTTRDLAGDYFGRFPGTTGGFALQVRADGSAIFLGHLPAAQTGFVVRDLTVDLTGRFALTFSTLAGTAMAASPPADAPSPPLAAASQTVTLRGTLDEASGTVTGVLPELGVTLEGTRAARSGPAQLHAGFYQAALLGSANDRGYFIVAPDGTVYGLISRAGQLSSVSEPLALSAEGWLVLPSTATNTSLELSFDRGALRGTVGAGTGASAVLAGAAGVLSGTEHLVNVSVRSVTSPGAATLITGFVVTGAAAKQVLIRVAGPALAAAPFNLPGVLPDPTLQLYRGSLVIAQNDDWSVPAASAAAITAAGTRVGAFAFRPGSADAALLTTLSPGAYTVVVGGGAGTTLAEVYEVLDANEAPGARRLVNLSARGITAPGSPLIAGFVVTGTAPQRVLVRGIGPTLGAPPFNVAGALPNPTLTLFRDATSLKTNDDWFRDADATAIREAAAKAGAFPLGGQSLDAALLLYLEPGAYTAQVAAAGNGTGVVLVEVYEAAP